MPLCLTHIFKNNFVISIVTAMVSNTPNLANLENLFITTKMASFSCHSKRHVMKFIETPLYGHVEIGKGLYNPSFFICHDLVFWHFTQVHMKCFTSSFILGQQKLVLKITLVVLSWYLHHFDDILSMSYCWHIMHFLHMTLVHNFPWNT